jgi:hypothetical protein
MTTTLGLHSSAAPLPRVLDPAVAANELQEQLLKRGEQLSLLEGDLTMREVMERAVRETHATINVERMWVEANAQKYCEKLSTNGVLAKVNIDLNKQLWELEVQLNEKKQDLKAREAALWEAVKRGTHPQDDQELLSKLVEVRSSKQPGPGSLVGLGCRSTCHMAAPDPSTHRSQTRGLIWHVVHSETHTSV